MKEEKKNSLVEIKTLSKEMIREHTMIDNPDNLGTGLEIITTVATIIETRVTMIHIEEEIEIRMTTEDKVMIGQMIQETTIPIKVNPTKISNSTIDTISPTKINHTKTTIKIKVNTKYKVKAIKIIMEINSSSTIKDKTTKCKTIHIINTTIDKGEITISRDRINISPPIRDLIINNNIPDSTTIKGITPIEIYFNQLSFSLLLNFKLTLK